jgi:hypothetical protein
MTPHRLLRSAGAPVEDYPGLAPAARRLLELAGHPERLRLLDATIAGSEIAPNGGPVVAVRLPPAEGEQRGELVGYLMFPVYQLDNRMRLAAALSDADAERDEALAA